MAEQIPDDAHSIVSGLTSLESEADDFEKLLIQNERDEKLLREAGSGIVHPFRKARIHPRVGLTMDNLERNNARNEAAQGANARASFGSPPGSGGSAISDPAIHAPAGWGRKSKVKPDWMRRITYEEDEQQQQQHTPVQTDSRNYSDEDANVPRHSIEDSPLSRKSAYGTPHRDGDADWDFTFDLNEASILASTPYIPRNTALEDIRQQEIESLQEQAVTKTRLGSIREGSPEERRRPQSPSTRSGNSMANSVASLNDQTMRAAGSPQKKLRTMTNSWQSLGKSQPTTAIGREDPPIAVYKSVETIGVVEREIVVSAQKPLSRRLGPRREDSQDLLRRLARVSNTPSPGRVEASRPQTAHGRRPGSSSQSVVDDKQSSPLDAKSGLVEEVPVPEPAPVDRPAPAPEVQSQHDEPPQKSPEPQAVPDPAPETPAEDVNTTPMPAEKPVLNPKTPVVTGAWVDTPGPRTALRTTNIQPPRSRSQSPRKTSPRKNSSPKKRTISLPASNSLEPKRPNLPTSALQALVQSARRESVDYGDSTINSLEDLISPSNEVDEDTLQGLGLPTAAPKNDEERYRQEEVLHLHRMNDKLRAARTSIRDASRGMKRLDDRVEHGEEEGERGRKVASRKKREGSSMSLSTGCPCAVDGGHTSVLQSCRSLFWDERLKVMRNGTRWRKIGGLTGLSIFLTTLAVWWISEEIACEFHCQPQYATSSPYPFSVNMDAPRYPYVLPTLFYRSFVRAWWLPLYTLLSGFLSVFGSSLRSSSLSAQSQGMKMGRAGQDQTHMHTYTRAWAVESQAAVVNVDDSIWEASMLDDEILKERKVRS